MAPQKPVECMRRPILNNTNPGQSVYDPFLGSGTTLIAAETTGRIRLGVELDPLYVEVAIRRWQAFTGKAATRLADGRTFAEVEGGAPNAVSLAAPTPADYLAESAGPGA